MNHLIPLYCNICSMNDLLIIFLLFHDGAFGNGHIDHFTDLLDDFLKKDITNIDKIPD